MTSVALLFPTLPPVLDGIGDYTSHLAESLGSRVAVQIYTAHPHPDAVRGVQVVTGCHLNTRHGRRRCATELSYQLPTWLILQYNPFSYGRYGFNPVLPEWLGRVKRSQPDLRIAVMVHEPFVPLSNWKFAVMTTWQRWQLWRLGHAVDLVFCAIEPWTQALRPYVAEGVPIIALPVGSNIPVAGFDREEARAALAIGPDELVVGVFGSARRRLNMIQAVFHRLGDLPAIRLLYVGPDGATLREAVGSESPLDDLGPLPAHAVSRALGAMDIHLAPYQYGVSARRGAFIAGLQHGTPSVSTVGAHTDPFLAQASGEAFVLTPDDDILTFADAVDALVGDPSRRRVMATAARKFYERHFSWSQISDRLLNALETKEREGRQQGETPSSLYAGAGRS